ncbi:MAG: CotH kinase family protein [Flavobacteriales bacterium]
MCVGHMAQAQLVINEVCTKNNSVLANAEGGHPDWVEIFNAGSGPIALSGYALSDSLYDTAPWHLPDMLLNAGEFLVLLSGDPALNELYFDIGLSSKGEELFLFAPDGSVVQSLTIPRLRGDHSFGRAADGQYRFFGTPTPSAANTTEPFLGYAPSPTFGLPPGSHAMGSMVELFAEEGSTIHVTWDGSVPEPTSPIYDWPFFLDHDQVIKAIATKADHLPSDMVTRSYFVHVDTHLPVISISADNDSLFDEVLGIYVTGPNADPEYPHYGANFWQDRTIPVTVEYFDEQRVRRLEQLVDLEIHGGRVSRNQPQRPLRLTARKAYGEDHMEYPFFPEKPWLERFKSLVLRNSGADFCLAEMRDQIWHQVALHNGLDIDVLAYRPVVVYINGQYWGMMELRERIDRHYLHYNYGADREDVLIMEEENLSIQGDTIHFHDLKEFIHTHDMNDPVHFAHVDSLFDIASFKDYCALEMFAGNVDWPSNNLKYWKPSVSTGKWRYLLYDLDATMNLYGWIPIDLDSFYWVLVHRAGFVHAEIFRSLLGNDEFRRTFLNRMADLMNTGLSLNGFGEDVSAMQQRIGPEVPHHFERWGCDLGAWTQHALGIIPGFVEVRGDIVREDVLNTFAFPHTIEVEVDVFPPGAGQLALNSLEPEVPFRGIYFSGNAIDLAVSASPGFHFDHWEYHTADGMERWETSLVQKDLPASGRITAYFERNDASLLVFPNPFQDHVDLSVTSHSGGTGEFSVFDPQGRLLLVRMRPLVNGVNAIRLDLRELPAGTYLLRSTVDGTVTTSRIMRLAVE